MSDQLFYRYRDIPLFDGRIQLRRAEHALQYVVKQVHPELLLQFRAGLGLIDFRTLLSGADEWYIAKVDVESGLDNPLKLEPQTGDLEAIEILLEEGFRLHNTNRKDAP